MSGPDLKEVADFLACEDAGHIIRAFANIRGALRTTSVAQLMAIASLEPVYVQVEMPPRMARAQQPRLEHHEEEGSREPQERPQTEPERKPEPQAAREPEREPERKSEPVTARTPVREPEREDNPERFFSETPELRIIERRIRFGMTVAAIAKAENMPRHNVQVILDAARERGMPVDGPFPLKAKPEPAKPPVVKAVTAKPPRRLKSEPLPPLPPQLRAEVIRVGVELRFQGYGPGPIGEALGVDSQMIQNAVWVLMQKDKTLVRPEVNPDLPPLGEHPLKALVIGARIAQGVLPMPKAETQAPETPTGSQPELPLEAASA